MAILKLNVNCVIIDEDNEYCGYWKYVDLEVVLVEGFDLEKVVKEIDGGKNLNEIEGIEEYDWSMGREFEEMEWDDEYVDGLEVSGCYFVELVEEDDD